MRRGVKAECARIAGRIRNAMRLSADAPIDPWKVAAHLDVPVIPLDALLDDPGAPSRAIQHFIQKAPDMLSAYTMWVNDQVMIVVNPGTSPERQVSSLAHELGHILLKHDPPRAIDPMTRCRNVSDEMEDEADWFGGVLLVSDEATLRVVRTGEAIATAATRYGVSSQLMQMRVNRSGAKIRINNEQRSRLKR